MSKPMQLVGSKISLISKSEIRYEGILFTINPTESTLALAKVRMFGTENRPTDTPVAPQDEVFEFIIFRGQDIKDIRLCEAPAPPPPVLPYDPAIVQHSSTTLPSMGGFQQQNPLASSMMRPAYGPLGIPGMYQNLVGPDTSAAPGGPLGQLGGGFGLGSGLGFGALGLSGPAAVAAASELPLSPREMPPHPDQGSETSGPGDQDLLGGVRSTSSTPLGQPAGPIGTGVRKSPSLEHGGQQVHREERRASSRGSVGNAQGPRDESASSQKSAGDFGASQRGAPGRGAPSGRRGGRSRGRGGPQNYGRYQPNGNQRPRDPLKFDGDYDFESANIKFEELKNKMGKMKIGNDTVLVLGGGTLNLADETQEKEKDKEPEQQEAVAATSEASAEPVEEEAKTAVDDEGAFYNKKKSFFDTISCEAVERSKGNMPRTDWRHERKLNAETFGLGFNRRGGYYRGGGGGGGGYRGRGGQYGGYQQRDGGYQQRDGGYQQRDGGFQQRDGGFQQRDGGYQQRGGMNRGGYRGGRGSRGGGAHGEGNGPQRGGYAPRRRDWGQQENRV